MAARPSWQGYLRLSLVTCPVAMLPATSEAEKVRFHTLNRATGNRVHSQYVDAETGKPVDDEDQVKGYEREDGEYVMLEDEEIECPIEVDDANYFLSTIELRKSDRPGMARWRKRLFIATSQITADAAESFGLPRDRTVIMGSHIDV